LPTSLPSTAPLPAYRTFTPPAPPLSINAPPPPPATTVPPTGGSPGIVFTNEAKPEGEKAHEAHEEHEKHEAHESEEEQHSGIIITGDFLLMRPVRRDQDYAIVGSSPNFGPLGVIRSVEGGYDTGFRIGAGYRCCAGWESVVSYTYLDTTGKDVAAAPTGQFAFPTTTFPGVVSRSAVASANNSIKMNLIDLEFAHHWKASEHLDWRFFFGPRLAFIDQRLNALYEGGDVATDSVRRRESLEGIGLRAGGQATYTIFEHLGAYARGAVTMMSAQVNADLAENANGVPIVAVSQKFHQLIPVLDMGIGLSYQMGNWRFTAGYELMTWFGMVEGIDFADDVTPGKLNRTISDLGFEGFVFRAEVVF
jgi:hypothetical protein